MFPQNAASKVIIDRLHINKNIRRQKDTIFASIKKSNKNSMLQLKIFQNMPDDVTSIQ